MDFGAELTPVSDGFEEQYSEYGPRIRLEQGLTQPERRRESMRYTLLVAVGMGFGEGGWLPYGPLRSSRGVTAPVGRE